MGLFSKLFGKKEKLQLNDPELGSFESLYVRGDQVGWQGGTTFFSEDAALFLKGNKEEIHPSEKTILLDALKQQETIEAEANKALAELYANAEKDFTKWQDSFSLIGLTVQENELEITFEENETYYHFNLYFKQGKCVGSSIDS